MTPNGREELRDRVRSDEVLPSEAAVVIRGCGVRGGAT